MSKEEEIDMSSNVPANKDELFLPFVLSYISTGSVTKASEEVGIAKKTGLRWMKRNDIQQLVIDKRNELAIKAEVEAGAIVKELKSLAFSRIEDFVDSEGKMLPLSEIGNTSAIQEIVVHDRVTGEGENQRKERSTKIKLVDKLGALKQLSDNLNLFAGSKAGKTIIQFNNLTDEQLRKISQGDTIDITPG